MRDLEVILMEKMMTVRKNSDNTHTPHIVVKSERSSHGRLRKRFAAGEGATVMMKSDTSHTTCSCQECEEVCSDDGSGSDSDGEGDDGDDEG